MANYRPNFVFYSTNVMISYILESLFVTFDHSCTKLEIFPR